MPYKSIKQDDGRYGVYATDQNFDPIGDPINTFDFKPEADLMVRELYEKSNEELTDEDGGYGSVISAIAATNEPFIALKDHPISLEVFNEKTYVRVPALVSGMYYHPWWGTLDYNNRRMNRILRNHALGICEQPVYFRPHHESGPATAYFDVDQGGWLEEEEENGDKLLVAYGPVTDDERAKIEVRDYRCASIDIWDNYTKAQIKKYENGSSGRMFSFSNGLWKYGKPGSKEVIMPKVITMNGQEFAFQEVDGGYVIPKAEFEKLSGIKFPDDKSAELQTALDKIAKLEAENGRIAELEAELEGLKPAKDDGLSEEARKQLEKERQLRRDAEKRELGTVIRYAVENATAFVDANGKKHSRVFLEWFERVLKGEAIGSGDEQIKLDKPDSAGAVTLYRIESALWLAKNMPGTVPAETKIDDKLDLDNPMDGDGNKDDEEYAAMAKASVAKYNVMNSRYNKEAG